MTQPISCACAGSTILVAGLHRTDLCFGSTCVGSPSLGWRIWLKIVEIKHWFGFHHPVDVHEWDIEADCVQYVGIRCLICDAEC